MQKVSPHDQLIALKNYYREKNIETIDDRIEKLELEYLSRSREEIGSGNSTRPNPKQYKIKESIGFISDTKFGLMRKILLFNRILGRNQFEHQALNIGNKRLGRKLYYSDLLNYFLLLQRLGIKLPRNFLSRSACELGLIDLLKKHNKIPASISHKNTFNSRELEKIRKSNESAFSRIIKFL